MENTHKKLNTPRIAPIYLITGDVPLLVQETRDIIKRSAKNAGYSQHQLFIVEPRFDWNTVANATQNRSLFDTRSIIDIRLPKFDEKATKTLLTYLENPSSDLCLILSTNKLTKAQKNTRWYKAIAAAGEIKTLWPLSLRELPQWIRTRLHDAQLTADKESIQLLAEYTEGNLHATRQAIEKLGLLYPKQTISIKEMLTALNDNARFNIFDLSNATRAKEADRSLRILNALRADGTEPTLILWALARECRSLAPQKRTMLTLLQRASKIDAMIKGRQTGNYWNALITLALAMAKTT